ncbi:hypothetical protein B0H14DRAFT_3500592 [Mycena olivaceomarginata]|nr:hypothetical protein B0H14DRAFT_3500592 [Mycena olivaceomarginata]
MPLFTNHAMTNIDTRRVRCPEAGSNCTFAFSIPEHPACMQNTSSFEPRTPPAYRHLPPAVSPPFASLVALTSRLPLLSASPVASGSRLRVSSPFSSRLALSSPFPSLPSLLYSTGSSAVSSSSLASPGSLSVFPVSFVDKG